MIEVTNGFVSARELHQLLDSKKAFSTWIKKKIKSAYLEQGKDFIPKWEESTGGRRSSDFMLTVKSAEHIAVIQQTQEGKKLREYLLGLKDKVENSELHTDDQVVAMVKLLAVFKYVCYQNQAEKKHLEKYITENKSDFAPASFHKWRNALLEIEPAVLDERIKQYCAENSRTLNVKSKKDKLLVIDKYSTIRNAVWDFLELKGELNALKIANLVKRMAEAEGTQLFRTNEDDLFRNEEALPVGITTKLLS